MSARRKAGAGDSDGQVFAEPVLDDSRADALDLDAIEAEQPPAGVVVASNEKIAAAKLGIADASPIPLEEQAEIADVEKSFLEHAIRFGFYSPAMRATDRAVQVGGQESEAKQWQKDGRRTGSFPHLRWRVESGADIFRLWWDTSPTGKSRLLSSQGLFELESRKRGYPAGHQGSIDSAITAPAAYAESRPDAG